MEVMASCVVDATKTRVVPYASKVRTVGGLETYSLLEEEDELEEVEEENGKVGNFFVEREGAT
ncbi:hypothetical protein FACS189472_12000 [Alphaproteobacteria bacterium]|nr:hypothetical protein FACS189472_12000 [Alphaproteobacteria bacterium]